MKYECEVREIMPVYVASHTGGVDRNGKGEFYILRANCRILHEQRE